MRKIILVIVTLLLLTVTLPALPVTATTTLPVKTVTVCASADDGTLYQSKQTSTTIEFLHGHFLLRDFDSQKQSTLVKDKKVSLRDQQMRVYVNPQDSTVSLMYDAKNHEVVYNNNTFHRVDNGAEVLNIQLALALVRQRVGNQPGLIVSGTNIRAMDDDGRLYYRVKVQQRRQKKVRLLQVYSDNGKIVAVKK